MYTLSRIFSISKTFQDFKDPWESYIHLVFKAKKSVPMKLRKPSNPTKDTLHIFSQTSDSANMHTDTHTHSPAIKSSRKSQ